MPDRRLDLAALQGEFAASLLRPGGTPPVFVTSHTARTPRRRFEVYRNNVGTSLAAVIAARYPVVQRLVGEEFFGGMARVFIEREPPKTPVMLEYGSGFAEFLETFEPVADLPYLADVARLEWLQALAHNAADAAVLSAEALKDVPVDRIGDIHFTLHPAVGLLSSPFPAYAIWRTNAHDDVVQRIGPQHGAEDVLVVRPHYQVEVARLPAGAFAFAQALRRGDSLAAATEHAGSTSDHFNLQTTLAGFLRAGALSSYRLSVAHAG